jgi:predicted helicase
MLCLGKREDGAIPYARRGEMHLCARSMQFDTLLEKYRKHAFSEKDKGARFERLMQAYLQTDPKYAHLLKQVWLWNEFPGRHDFGGTDTGIDLVALTVDGDYWAVQCKCYQESTAIDKPAVDSFLATSSREFKDEALRTTRFAHRLWISTTNHLTLLPGQGRSPCGCCRAG